MSAFLTLLNATSHLDQIPFATVIILELSQDTAGMYYVTLKMQSNTTTVPINLVALNISTCGQLCSLGNFFDLNSENMISTNLREACSIDSSFFTSTTTKYPSAGCLPPTNGTLVPFHSQKKGFSSLEIGLIVACSALGAIILALLIIIGLICYRNKIRKASF